VKIPDEVVAIARQLGDLREKVVFVGGMARGMLVTDPAVDGPRPTKDVDVILDVKGVLGFNELCATLRQLGFRDDPSDDAPICRFVLRSPDPDTPNTPVDFMPLDPEVLGFSNVWYPEAFQSSQRIETSAGSIRVIDAPSFVATKLESFAARGRGDYYHHDLEDVVVLVDGRSSLVPELSTASSDLREFVGDEIAGLLSDDRFRDCLPGHLSPDDVSQQRLPLVLSRLQQIAELAARENRISASGATEWGIRPLAPDRTTRAPTTAARTALGGEVWQPLRSSDISAFAYDRTSRVLTVRFRSGSVYEYYDVPRQVFDGWKTAASAGWYHRRWIRDRYRYRRIRG
jgi:hypothetical protein